MYYVKPILCTECNLYTNKWLNLDSMKIKEQPLCTLIIFPKAPGGDNPYDSTLRFVAKSATNPKSFVALFNVPFFVRLVVDFGYAKDSAH